MEELRKFFADQMAAIFSGYESLELRGCIDDKSYALEFFVTINGERRQCYEMADQGVLLEKQVDEILQSIAQYARTLPGYVHGELNSVNVSITSGK